MMLAWLGDRHNSNACKKAAKILDSAVEKGFASGKIRPAEFGGPQGTQDVTAAIIEIIEE